MYPDHWKLNNTQTSEDEEIKQRTNTNMEQHLVFNHRMLLHDAFVKTLTVNTAHVSLRQQCNYADMPSVCINIENANCSSDQSSSIPFQADNVTTFYLFFIILNFFFTLYFILYARDMYFV